MGRKVVQTELEPGEYSRLAARARKKGLTIKEALRQAALQWTFEEAAINPNDPIFHAKAEDWGKGTESVARDHDKHLYGGKLRDSFGAWKMTDNEEERIFSGLQKNWKTALTTADLAASGKKHASVTEMKRILDRTRAEDD